MFTNIMPSNIRVPIG